MTPRWRGGRGHDGARAQDGGEVPRGGRRGGAAEAVGRGARARPAARHEGAELAAAAGGDDT